MKIKFTLLLLFTLFTSVTFSQKTDSLLNVFNNGKHDTLKIKAAIALSREYKKSNKDLYVKYLNEAYTKSAASNYPELTMEALYNLCSYSYDEEKYSEGYSWLTKLEALGESTKNTTIILKAMDSRYELYNSLGMLERCVDIREKMADIYHKQGLELKEARMYHLAGWVCYNAKMYDEGLRVLRIAERIYKKNKQEEPYHNAIGWLGNTLGAVKKFDSALYYRDLVLDFAIKGGSKFGIGEAYRYKGDVYANMRKFDVALDYYNKAIEQFNQANAGNREFLLRTYKVRMLDSLGRSKEAATELDYVAANSDKYTESIVTSYLYKIGKTLYVKVNEPYKAFYYFRKNDSLVNANNRNDAQQQIILAEFKSDVEKNEAIVKKEYEKQQAIANANLQNQQLLLNQRQKDYLLLEKENELKQLSLIQSQLKLKQNDYEIENQRKKVELLNKDKELSALEALKNEEDIRRQRNLISVFTVVGIIMLVLFFFLGRMYIQKRKDHQTINIQKDIVEEKQKEILASIHYAKRIQQALITSEAYIDKHLKRLNKGD